MQTGTCWLDSPATQKFSKLNSYSVFFVLLAVHLSQVYDLEAKADTQDEGCYGGDKAREEGIEGEGSHL